MSETEYFIAVKELPEKGKANARVKSLLAKQFKVSVKNILIKNPSSRVKRVHIVTNVDGTM